VIIEHEILWEILRIVFSNH